jgi:formylglycine-generating enzyme required for sulfatase activity
VLIEAGNHRVKITDFGLARAADDASLTKSGVVAGTPMYMAPEQAEGESLDHRADLFSLGSVMYIMATGRPPFRAATTYAVLKRVVEDEPRPIREVIPEMPRWLCDIIAKLHTKKPGGRFQSAREVTDVLAACEAQLTANAKLKDFSCLPQSKPATGAGRWKWVAAAALLLPVVALALAKTASETPWLQTQQPAPGPLKSAEPDYTNTLGMRFKLIPAGKFRMGSPQEEIDRCLAMLAGNPWWESCIKGEGPEHDVEITQPFYLGTTEVTVGQFRQFVTQKNYQVGDARWQQPGWRQTDDHPVVWVNWQNAVDFCDWLSEKEGQKNRLPTEAEWEYSCRAGTSGAQYCYGDDDQKGELNNYAWSSDKSGGGTHRVGEKKPNGWGLYDMHGNAWEWCQDHADLDYYKHSPVKDPPGSATPLKMRVLRGGSWDHDPVCCRSAFRAPYFAADRGGHVGFRVLLVPPPAGARTESEE